MCWCVGVTVALCSCGTHLDQGILGRRVVVERVDGHPPVELLVVVAALRAEVVNLVVAAVSGLHESERDSGLSQSVSEIVMNLRGVSPPAVLLRVAVHGLDVLLEARHSGHFEVYNLCSERSYDPPEVPQAGGSLPFRRPLAALVLPDQDGCRRITSAMSLSSGLAFSRQPIKSLASVDNGSKRVG